MWATIRAAGYDTLAALGISAPTHARKLAKNLQTGARIVSQVGGFQGVSVASFLQVWEIFAPLVSPASR
ncbi:hypothetical protein MTBUT4_180001 [Magnetospirillum sp. UT-4]|nr:hypothetical protein MTBUT4_180001 [Magnetospirillum sp. UT-4]